MRAVRVEWADSGSVCMETSHLELLLQAIMGDEVVMSFSASGPDEVVKVFVGCGHTFLDRIRNCSTKTVIRQLDPELRPTACFCLENLKALEPGWRDFIDSRGHLEVWVDAY